MPSSQFSPTVETIVASVSPSDAGSTEIATLSNGNILIAWRTLGAVELRLIDPDGNVLRSITNPGSNRNPEVVPTADGGFILSWHWEVSFHRVIAEPFLVIQNIVTADVFAARYDLNGTPVGETLVNDFPDLPPQGYPFIENYVTQTDPAVALLGSGGWVVLYEQHATIRMQRFDSTGAKIGASTLVEDTTSGRGRDPTVTALADGGFVATWTTGVPGNFDIVGQRFDGGGARVGGEFVVAASGGEQTRAQVAALESGGFVVVWQDGVDVRGRRFDAGGNPLDGAFDLDSAAAGPQATPHVVAYPGGGFVAVWLDGAGASNRIVARLFADDGAPATDAFAVNSASDSVEAFPEVTVRADGSLEFVWITEGPGSEARTRIFVPGAQTGDPTGTPGIDILTGDSGDNVLSGLGAADILVGGGGGDSLLGGDGIDTANYAGAPGAVSVDLAGLGGGGDAEGDSYSSVENAAGSAFGDVLAGDDEANRLDGAEGDDVLNGRRGADMLVGGAGVDTADYSDSQGAALVNLTLGQGFGNSAEGDVYSGIESAAGSAHDDVLIGGAGVNRLDGAGGDDILVGALGADALIGGNGGDTANYQDSAGAVRVDLAFGQGFDHSAEGDTYSGIEDVTGSRYDDVLTGDGAGNSLDGWDGDDLLIGAGGADALIGGDGADTVSYAQGSGAVFVNLNIGQGFGNAAEGDTYSGIENVVGTILADMLIGTTGANRLDGHHGDDILVGSAGADILDGGRGSDTASYGDNWGAVFVNLGTGQGFGNAAEGDVYDRIENVAGSIFDDALLGNAGANRLGGGFGNDMLVGHGGFDQFLFDSALSAAANLDTIADFAPGVDKILLDNAVFAGLAGGALAPNAFIAAPAATGGSNRIVYDQATGALYYDPDGFGGDPAIQFATLTSRPTLTSADFLVI